MSVQPDPEDYGLRSQALAAQNNRVIQAQQKGMTQTEIEEEEALDRLEQAFKGKPIDEDWDPNSHPYFMTDVQAEIDKGNPVVDGFKQLLFEDPPEEIAENLKKQGNDALKRGPKYYEDAVKCYTRAIDAGSSDMEKVAVYYSNRAAVELLRKNYGKVIKDCEEATKRDPNNVKAYYRAAKALAGLSKWPQVLEKCEEGLKIDSANKELQKEMDNAKAKQQAKLDEQKKKDAAKAKAFIEESSKGRAVRKACEERGIRMGESVYDGLSGGQKADPFIDSEGKIHWPVLIVYDEFDQSDYLQDVDETADISDVLAMLFDPSQPPPEWDPTRRYSHKSTSLYFASYQCKELEKGSKKTQSDADFISGLLSGSERKGVEKEYERAEKSEWVKIDKNKSLLEALQQEGHIVSGIPVLHVVETNSVYERHLLSTGPGI